jgi:hypothetical protein
MLAPLHLASPPSATQSRAVLQPQLDHLPHGKSDPDFGF